MRARCWSRKPTRAQPCNRGGYLDYIGVRIFDARGRVTGEHRFLGLWTTSANDSSPQSVPLLKDKISAVASALNAAAGSHDAKAVAHVLATYPRDELFQANIPELVRSVRGIVNLYERSQVRLFARRDPFDRFYSCLVYVPRDRYDTRVRARIEAVLRAELGGQSIESQVEISESTLARLYVVVRLGPNPPRARRSGQDRARRGASGLDLAGRAARGVDGEDGRGGRAGAVD